MNLVSKQELLCVSSYAANRGCTPALTRTCSLTPAEGHEECIGAQPDSPVSLSSEHSAWDSRGMGLHSLPRGGH